MSHANRRSGFTLLEVLVATTLMAIAVTGLLNGLSMSMRNISRISSADRAALLAQRKLDELMTAPRLPKGIVMEGAWDPAVSGGALAGWRAMATIFEVSPNPGPGSQYIERIAVEIWWESPGGRRTFPLDGYRRSVLLPEDMPLVPRGT